VRRESRQRSAAVRANANSSPTCLVRSPHATAHQAHTGFAPTGKVGDPTVSRASKGLSGHVVRFLLGVRSAPCSERRGWLRPARRPGQSLLGVDLSRQSSGTSIAEPTGSLIEQHMRRLGATCVSNELRVSMKSAVASPGLCSTVLYTPSSFKDWRHRVTRDLEVHIVFSVSIVCKRRERRVRPVASGIRCKSTGAVPASIVRLRGWCDSHGVAGLMSLDRDRLVAARAASCQAGAASRLLVPPSTWMRPPPACCRSRPR
jgi:hypothetical protein